MIDEMRAVQTMQWIADDNMEGGGMYQPLQWSIQFRRSVTDPWEELKVITNYIGGPHNNKTTVNKKDIEQ